jgi:hypothetical protein
MQAYRLMIGPDGSIKIPNGEPGRIVTVLVDASPSPMPTASVKPVAAMSGEERARLRDEVLAQGRRIRARLNDQPPVDHDSELYGDDGLPR